MTSDYQQSDKLVTQTYTDFGEFKGFWQTCQTLCEFESQAMSLNQSNSRGSAELQTAAHT